MIVKIDSYKKNVLLLLALVPVAILYSLYQIINFNIETSDFKEKSQKRSALSSFYKMPVSFVPNNGQVDKRVKYYAQGAGYDFYATDNGITYLFTKNTSDNSTKRPDDKNKLDPSKKKLQALSIKIAFDGANPNARIIGSNQQSSKVNYLIGNDKSKWRTNVPTFRGITYKDIYTGIDLTYKETQGDLKYEFVVAPGKNPSFIQLSYSGIESLDTNENGDLAIKTAWGTLFDKKPYVFQVEGGRKTVIPSKFIINGKKVGFEIGEYNKSLPLVIDPKLDYSTFIGSAGNDTVSDITVDAGGNAYITGYTDSTTFPTTSGVLDNAYTGGEQDAFVSKFNAEGSALIFSTYIGGSTGDYWGFGYDYGHIIKLDSSDNICVIGHTSSSDFPVITGSYDTSYNGTMDIFYFKLNSTGTSLSYSTFIGGSGYDSSGDIAFDGSNNTYIVGKTESANFPKVTGSYDISFNGGYYDAFALKLNSTGTSLAYSTYIGGSTGSTDEKGTGVVVDGSGNAIICGYTESSSFPTVTGSYDTTHNGMSDVFMSKLNSTGTSLSYSTFIGSASNDYGSSLLLDTSGYVYVTGVAGASSFPKTTGAYDTSFNGGGPDAFLLKLDSTGTSLAYSTYLGASANGVDVSMDSAQNIYVSGNTSSSTFPTTTGAFDTTLNSNDVFLTKFNPSATFLLYSTFLGGANWDETGSTASDTSGQPHTGGTFVDSSGKVYLSGVTGSSDFPTTTGAYDTLKSGGNDGFITKLNIPEVTSITITPANPNGSNGWYKTSTTVALSRNQAGTTSYQWDYGSWNIYTSARSVPQGEHTFSYYSVVGGVTEAVQTETLKVDTGLPTDPTGASPSHETNKISTNKVVTVNLSGQSDAVSGIDGFSVLWDALPSTVPPKFKNSANVSNIRSPVLADGSWYFHLSTVDYAGNWTSTVHLGPFEISVTRPHGGYSSTTNKCRVCHVVHNGSDTSYKLLRNGNTTESRSTGEGNVSGMGNAKSTICMFCHDASSGFTAKRPYELSALGISVKGEHRIGATLIPDSNINGGGLSGGLLANRDPSGEGAVLQCYQCHTVHAADSIGQDNDGDGNPDPAKDGNIYDSDDGGDNWNTKILRLDPSGDGSYLGIGGGGLSSAAWESELVTSAAAVRTGFCADCHNKNSNWLLTTDDDTNRVNKSSHPQGPGADGLMTVSSQPNTIVARHVTVRQGCRGCHIASTGLEATSRFPHQSVGWRLLYDKYTTSYGGDPSAGIPEMDRVCLRCHLPSDAQMTGGYTENEESMCFTCHSAENENSEAPDIESELAKSSHHPVSEGFEKHTDGEEDDPSKLGASNRHAECVDCHNLGAAAQDGVNPLKGQWGVDVVNGAAGTTPSYNQVSSIDKNKQYQLCFKCHSSYTSQPTTAYYKDNSQNPITQGDKSLELNPNNSSYHPVESAGRNRSEALRQQLEGASLTTTSTLKCTDCHNSNSSGDVRGAASNSNFRPKGPHGSSYAPILRKGYKTNNYPLDGGFDVDNFELCFLCHDQAKLTGQTGFATNYSKTTTNYHYLHLLVIFDAFGLDGPLCRTCHYNVHSNQKAINTEYVVWWSGGSTWSYYQSPPDGLKTRLINFGPEPAIRGLAPTAKPQWIVNVDSSTHSFGGKNFSPRQRACNLDCHTSGGYYPKSVRWYLPSAGLDNDPMTY